MASRVQSTVPAAEAARFDDVIRIYSKKDQVHLHNHIRMRDLRRPVLIISVRHDGREANKASTAEAGNLPAELPMAIGCRIMLMEDLWVERGLANGIFGTVHDILRSGDVIDPRKEPPFTLLVHFDQYTGPAFHTNEEGRSLVPIFMSKPHPHMLF
ncbi:hypothetical protein N7486_003044 [Penicillium sp. IBT 16267x]|nr:hypothetical protein N7486_003044 [Penicillium sp. IBT 16267x]